MKIPMIDELSVEELCGQLLCTDLTTFENDEQIFESIKRNKPGAIYVCNFSKERIKRYVDYANTVCKYPLLVVADMENGVGCYMSGETELPSLMAWGACDDEKLVEKAGENTSVIARSMGVHITLAPVVDININKDNPLVNIRSVSDSAKQVIKITSAYIRGIEKKGYMVACPKHFPGDGVDDRNQHFCVSINRLSKDEWKKTYGKVYKNLIDSGISAIMAAHIALPSCEKDEKDSIFGPLPSVLSKSLLTGLLRNELGFKGCIISDAMSMIGSSSRVPLSELAPRFVSSGGDMVLFHEKNDLNNLTNAVNNGTLSKERLVSAVNNILLLKEKLKLFETQENIVSESEVVAAREAIKEVAEAIAEKSVKIERDVDKILPLSLKEKSKILMINLYKDVFKCVDDDNKELLTLEEEFRQRGYIVDVYHRITHYEINRIKDDYDLILINSKISSADYRGGDLRIGWWDGIMIFWRAYILNHPRVVFVSFGDPYKLYELPFLKTYVNAFSSSQSTQRAVVKLLTGEIEQQAKNPVELKDFFNREVE